ncbi:MAG: hypothetical protein PHI02_03660 [Sulfurovaceae bacterium]|nr:hypothetical protein [Sulfurovaceae bacterium]
MSSQFHWTNIISLNSLQNNAFEELVCQLAKKENIPNKKEYIKVGNPDGGVECYVVLNNGDEIGFQAKYFLSSFQEAQWSQIEKSFKTALEKHPNMISYYVAIPLDRPNPKIDGKKSMMDKWNEKVKKWKKFAKDTYDKDIEFEYWGDSELITRLSREENAGLIKFFFGVIDLSKEWFKNQNELVIKDLGARYTPEINVELEIVENFNALSRNNTFKEQIDKLYHEMMVDFRKLINRHNVDENLIENFEKLKMILIEFESEYFQLNFTGIEEINFEIIESYLNNIGAISENTYKLLEDLNEKEIKEKNIKTEMGYRTATSFDGYLSDLRSATRSLYDFKNILTKPLIKLVNNPYMILKGEAGIGKSHLLADIINQRLEEGNDSIFLLGQQFMQEKSPWSQILDDLLRLKCNEDEFLGALNAKAEVKQKRTIIFIDAINEGKGRNFWKDYLVSFVESIKKYEWLGLVLSIRSSYVDLVIPEGIKNDDTIAAVTHYGFDEIEYDASKIFFKYYNIEQPTIPLLHPEFSNPLFLKLFCEGLQKKGLVRVPEGYEGISNIIKFFIEGIEDKLIHKYEPIKRLKLLNKIIDNLIIQSLENQVIAYDIAYEKVEDISSKYGLSSGLLDDLISEGLLTQNLQYDYATKEYHETVYFVYERFEDHLKVKYLFEQFLDKDNPKESFEKEPLCGYFEEDKMYYNRGIIDAMSIQLPEVCNVELIDMIDQNQVLVESFFESLLWRKVDSISQYTVDRVLKNIDNSYIQKNIFETFFLIASNTKHPLNANLMHEYLKDFSMKDRDVWFISLLNDIYLDYGINPIKRIIDWSWSDEDKSYISDESLLLNSIALSWFLTTSNRKLRDYSTKALISILQGRISTLLELLKKFEGINELYIQERLLAVAFGVTVRTENNTKLKDLGEYIYKTIFDTEEVIIHILLRDYAKSTIDYISYLGIELDIDFEKIKPPYKSYFPSIEELPTNEDLAKYEDKDDGYNQSRIISSMMTEHGGGMYGDFGRYVFGSKLYDFECKKDEQLISNYATRKIFEDYGYNGSFFNDAEKSIQENNRYGYNRHNHKIERIGKKYQWIAMHDTLARVMDNFKMRDHNSGWNGEEKVYIDYQGSYEPCVRDIDPTILLKETKSSWYIETDSKFWWSVKTNFQWKMDNKEWINFTSDIQNPKNSIFFIDDSGQEWIALDSSPNWIEPIKKGVDKSSIVYKKAWYILHGYLIPNEHINEFKAWAENQSFWNNWMPDAKEHYQMFNREFYWSDMYAFFQNPYYGYEEWSEIDSYGLKAKYPHKIGLTTSQYYWESEFDYSKEDSLRMNKPSNILFEGMKMRYSAQEGHFIDQNGEIICFDPSIYHESNPYLMVRKDKLIQFLSENNLTICWTLLGEKQVITPSFGRDDSMGVMQMSGYVSLDGTGIINVKDAEHESERYNIKLKIEDMDIKQ